MLKIIQKKKKLRQKCSHKMISTSLKRFSKLHCLNPSKLKSFDKELCNNLLCAYTLFQNYALNKNKIYRKKYKALMCTVHK